MSATRDGQTDQSLFYFDMFGFGDRIRAADVLVLGSSHAEFGISAEMLGGKRSFNMALGGGESLYFAAALLRRYHPTLQLAVFDPFASDSAGPSIEAKRIFASSRGESYRWVFNIWAGFARDWVLQGLLPRVTISLKGVQFEQPLGVTIIRDWHTADATSVYSGTGELYTDPGKGHHYEPGPEWLGFVPNTADLVTIKDASKSVVVTALPYPSYNDTIGRDAASKIGALFVPMSSDGLLFWDYHHLDASGRQVATSRLLEAIAANSRK